MTDAPVSRDHIAHAARETLARHGIAKLTVRAVATAAGCSTTGIYTHFGGKQELLDHLFIEAFSDFRAALLADVRPTRRDDLRKRLERYRSWALANPARYLLMFAARASGYHPSEVALRASEASFDDFEVDVAAVTAEGELEGDPRRIALHLWSAAHGYVMLEVTGPGQIEQDAERTYRDGVRASLAAFTPSASASP